MTSIIALRKSYQNEKKCVKHRFSGANIRKLMKYKVQIRKRKRPEPYKKDSGLVFVLPHRKRNSYL